MPPPDMYIGRVITDVLFWLARESARRTGGVTAVEFWRRIAAHEVPHVGVTHEYPACLVCGHQVPWERRGDTCPGDAAVQYARQKLLELGDSA